MILQALNEYYQRKPGLPREGWMEKEIDFVAVVDAQGSCQALNSMLEKRGKNWVGKSYEVPAIAPRALKHDNSGSDPNLLWDNVSFALGYGNNGKKKARHFRKELRGWFRGKTDDPAILGLRRFLVRIARYPIQLEQLLDNPDLQKPEIRRALDNGGAVAFRFSGDLESLVCHRPAVRSLVGLKRDPKEQTGTCLISGDREAIARLHNSLEGITDKPGSPARKYLVSFQENMGLDSYGKEKGSNAPVGKRAAFAYTTTLNHLLASKQRLQVGDASTVFWAAADSRMESLLAQFFDEPPQDNPDQGTNAVKELLEAPLAGTPAIYDDGTRFYVLGLAPNAARIAVRFWHVATVGELANHIRQHFEDLEIVRPQYVERPFLSIKALLIAVSPLGDLDKLPPKLAGDFMKAILDGASYPQTLLQAALRRIHAEQAKKDEKGRPKEHVTYARSALIKAWLNRLTRNTGQNEEITVSLDENNTNIGYRLGRLFAVLEKVQADANPGLNTTIRDSYFGSASSTPSAVFPTLMRRNQHHMTKLRKEKPGLYIARDKLIQTICNDGIDGQLGFTPILSLADQGRFVIGYYQQRQNLFTKS
ncbi:MAG: type I-C CRISPR-associated protein Cas8c/Csd1 [Thiobacillus sp.]